MYTVESKSMLARLMASENLKVEHRSTAKTAKFDLKNRRLICPLWKDMGGDLYDLLMGHEISHALNTPLEGWHDSIVYAGGEVKASKKSQKSFRHFLNVIEDARIEKLVKRQYPGLRGPMARGYKDLMARDFFGLHGRSKFNDLYLIDKLNLSAKVGSLLHITFNAKEQPFYDAMLALETWDDVVVLTKKLYAYSKAEQKEGQEEKKKKAAEEKKKKEEERKKAEEEQKKEDESGEPESEDEEGEDEEHDSEGEGTGDEDEDEDGFEPDSETDQDDDADTEEGEDSDEDKGEDEDAGEEGGGETSESDESDDKESTPDEEDQEAGTSGGDAERDGDTDEDFVPKASTDEEFREHEEDLVERKDVRSLYLTIPTPNLKHCVTPVAIVNKGISDFYQSQRVKGKTLLGNFHKKNDDYIGLLAKEFEMKKAAKSYKNSRQSESGDIDITKLASYRTEDNIFKKLMIVHKGKSHGLVLLLDRSSSMEQSIIGATEQILILALFCRKVNIPFVAYSFMDNDHAANEYDFGPTFMDLKPFSQNPEEFATKEVAFREMLNSTMQPFEFNQAVMNQLQLSDGLGNRRREYSVRGRGRRQFSSYYGYNEANYPAHEAMGSTPLIEALVILRDVVRLFRAKHHLDIVNTILVHDGEANGSNAFHEEGRVAHAIGHLRRASITDQQKFNTEDDRVTILDKKERLSFLCPQERGGLRIALQVWFQTTTGSGLFGFYVLGSKTSEIQEALGAMYVNELGIPLGTLNCSHGVTSETRLMHNALLKKLEDEKFLESHSKGYTRFYFIPGHANLRAESGELVNTGKSDKWTGRTLLTAFVKANKKRAVSRVLVSRFIDQIAVH